MGSQRVRHDWVTNTFFTRNRNSEIKLFTKVLTVSAKGRWDLNYVFTDLLFIYFNYLLIYFWLHWVFVAAWGPSLVAASRGPSLAMCSGFSLWRLLFWGAQVLGDWASGVVAHGLSGSLACGIFLHQGMNVCPLHWKVVSEPLDHKGSPQLVFFIIVSFLSPSFWPCLRNLWQWDNKMKKNQTKHQNKSLVLPKLPIC